MIKIFKNKELLDKIRILEIKVHQLETSNNNFMDGATFQPYKLQVFGGELYLVRHGSFKYEEMLPQNRIRCVKEGE